MESTKAPTPTALAVGALALIWTEVVRRKVSIWVGVKDSMEVMEIRRKAIAAQDATTGLPEGAKPPKPRASEARSTYERMHDTMGVRFE